MIRIIPFLFLLISFNLHAQNLILSCRGVVENFYEQNPHHNDKSNETREYKFINGKLNGKYDVKWTTDKIFYQCKAGTGNGCSDKFEGGTFKDFHQIEISRNTGEVTELGSVKFDKKLNLSNARDKFRGTCEKIESRKF